MVSVAGVSVCSEKTTTILEWPKPKRYRDMKCYYHGPSEKVKRWSYIVSSCQYCHMVKTEHQIFIGLLHNLLLPDCKWDMLIVGFLIGLWKSCFMENSV